MNKRENVYTVESHFSSKDPIVREIYDRLLKTIRQLGRVGRS
jgi:hypothetical protein